MRIFTSFLTSFLFSVYIYLITNSLIFLLLFRNPEIKNLGYLFVYLSFYMKTILIILTFSLTLALYYINKKKMSSYIFFSTTITIFLSVIFIKLLDSSNPYLKLYMNIILTLSPIIFISSFLFIGKVKNWFKFEGFSIGSLLGFIISFFVISLFSLYTISAFLLLTSTTIGAILGNTIQLKHKKRKATK